MKSKARRTGVKSRPVGLRKSSKKENRHKLAFLRRQVVREVHRLTPDMEVRGSSTKALYSFPGVAHGTPPNSWTLNNIFDVSDIYSGISQGTGEGNRIGNVIRPRKMSFSFLLLPNQATQNSPINVRMWILTFKFDPNNAVAADIWGSMQNWNASGGLNRSFFDDGSTTSGMDGTLTDLMKPVNTDAWTVHKCKTYKVGHSSTPVASASVSGNNDYKLNVRKTVNLLPYIPKRITYNDANTNSLNKKVFIVFECLKADGLGNDVTSKMCDIFYNYHFKYEST